MLSVIDLAARLRAERPHVPVYVSTTTLAGRAIADQKLGSSVFFAPLDYRSVLQRVLRRLRPAVVVVLETEIWPNLYRESKRAGASLMIVNGRISDRALPRYRRRRAFFRHVLCWPDAILVQTEEDRRRFIASGAGLQPAIRVAGNLKYDFTPPAAITPELASFLDRIHPEKIWIAASTMPPAAPGDVDEDDAVFKAMPRRPGMLLILAPRKPERFDLTAEKLARAKIPFLRRSRGLDNTTLDLPGVLLLDTIGELAALFERADVVFMGGTLADRGGHNVLEPAWFGKPVIAGPHMENFAEIASEFDRAGALARIQSADQLGAAVAKLLDHPGDTGAKARELAMSRRGVTARVATEIWQAYDGAIPSPKRTLTARALLTPLSWLWRAGNHIHAWRRPRSLATPVISVGALTMGGAGKSPMVAHLARRLREMGRNPAILTRGYRRESREPLIVARGAQAKIALTGDEAQILIRRGDAHVGIGADRFSVGRRLEQELAPDVFLLDDGFQHRRLGRARDIVLIDALDPFAGGVFPLGRLREPPRSLARAPAIVLTRCEPGRSTRAIERVLTRYNARAPVFRSRVVPLQWMDAQSGDVQDVAVAKLGRVAAFCGLGEPRSFWLTLERLDVDVTLRRTFRDHHRYSADDLKTLAAQAAETGAGALVTTEKDFMNLSAAAPMKLYWLKIDIEIEKEDELLQLIL